MAQKEHEFTLVLSGMGALASETLDALFESGCDDALFGMRDGIAFADFCRAAPTFQKAVLSAIRDIEHAGLGVKVEHLEPDELVTMSEIARRLCCSREGIRKWVAGTRGPGAFPIPVGHLKQRSPLWRWIEVLRWHQAKSSEGDSAANAVETNRAAINAALNLRRYATLDDGMKLFATIAKKK